MDSSPTSFRDAVRRNRLRIAAAVAVLAVCGVVGALIVNPALADTEAGAAKFEASAGSGFDPRPPAPLWTGSASPSARSSSRATVEQEADSRTGSDSATTETTSRAEEVRAPAKKRADRRGKKEAPVRKACRDRRPRVTTDCPPREACNPVDPRNPGQRVKNPCQTATPQPPKPCETWTPGVADTVVRPYKCGPRNCPSVAPGPDGRRPYLCPTGPIKP